MGIHSAWLSPFKWLCAWHIYAHYARKQCSWVFFCLLQDTSIWGRRCQRMTTIYWASGFCIYFRKASSYRNVWLQVSMILHRRLQFNRGSPCLQVAIIISFLPYPNPYGKMPSPAANFWGTAIDDHWNSLTGWGREKQEVRGISLVLVAFNSAQYVFELSWGEPRGSARCEAWASWPLSLHKQEAQNPSR